MKSLIKRGTMVIINNLEIDINVKTEFLISSVHF